MYLTLRLQGVPRKKRVFSAEAKARISEGMKKKWADRLRAKHEKVAQESGQRPLVISKKA
jgi:hypothetical protein